MKQVSIYLSWIRIRVSLPFLVGHENLRAIVTCIILSKYRIQRVATFSWLLCLHISYFFRWTSLTANKKLISERFPATTMWYEKYRNHTKEWQKFCISKKSFHSYFYPKVTNKFAFLTLLKSSEPVLLNLESNHFPRLKCDASSPKLGCNEDNLRLWSFVLLLLHRRGRKYKIEEIILTMNLCCSQWYVQEWCSTWSPSESLQIRS